MNDYHQVKVPIASVKEHFNVGDNAQFVRNGINQTGKVDKVEGGKVFISGESAGQPFKVKIDAELAEKSRVSGAGPRPSTSHADDISDPDPASAPEIADQGRKVAKLESDLNAV